MSQDHYVYVGSRSNATYMVDKAIVYDPDLHHLEPIRGSSYTLAVFDLDSTALSGLQRAIGYCTTYSLGFPDAKAWMAATGYKESK